jgi:hypothetical protein
LSFRQIDWFNIDNVFHQRAFAGGCLKGYGGNYFADVSDTCTTERQEDNTMGTIEREYNKTLVDISYKGDAK